MPELPDIVTYVDALAERLLGQAIVRAFVRSPALLRTADPPLRDAVGRTVLAVERIGKRLVLALDQELYLVLHLMIAGRLHWKRPGLMPTGKYDSAVIGFPEGSLLVTEASTKKRAELHLVRGVEALDRFRRGGLDVMTSDVRMFAAALARENHTLKRALTDPRLFDGIGNAYSDEILHAARLSPLAWTSRLTPDEIERLHRATLETLRAWIDRLQQEREGGFPGKVTAFRPEMAVHGKYKKPCPVCGTAVQRIRYADNETDYCPRCQTAGKLLADRSLSRLLKDDWPRTIEDLEELKERQLLERAGAEGAAPSRTRRSTSSPSPDPAGRRRT